VLHQQPSNSQEHDCLGPGLSRSIETNPEINNRTASIKIGLMTRILMPCMRATGRYKPHPSFDVDKILALYSRPHPSTHLTTRIPATTPPFVFASFTSQSEIGFRDATRPHMSPCGVVITHAIGALLTLHVGLRSTYPSHPAS
jgi:hypothetical protein